MEKYKMSRAYILFMDSSTKAAYGEEEKQACRSQRTLPAAQVLTTTSGYREATQKELGLREDFTQKAHFGARSQGKQDWEAVIRQSVLPVKRSQDVSFLTFFIFIYIFCMCLERKASYGWGVGHQIWLRQETLTISPAQRPLTLGFG